MSQFIDKSEKLENSAVPEPELNPLLNPLLAANMGRWAEVYFTSPPEQRAHAVAELVRQLELESAGKTAAPTASVAPESLNERTAVCGKCGHTNPESYRFCGMCGALLRPSGGEPLIEATPEAPLPADFVLPPEPESLSHESEFSGREDQLANNELVEQKSAAGSSFDRSSERYDSVFPPPLTEASRKSFFSARPLTEDDLPQFARQAEPVPLRYRIYLGLVIAVVLGALINMERRGDVSSGSQQSPAAKAIPAQPAPPTEAAQPQSPPPLEKIEKSETPPPAKTKPQQAVRAKKVASPSPGQRSKPQPPAIAASMTAQTASTGPGGAEELAQAQKYMSGSYGTSRDAGEAAQWLWKAVAKGNGPAALMLSDLYLHGDGIAQNCDQAHLLLDVAAKKGVKGAAERLRNMQAFGCR